jgi:hypothetical protein
MAERYFGCFRPYFRKRFMPMGLEGGFRDKQCAQTCIEVYCFVSKAFITSG